jgi:hypothetical protein
VLWVVACGTSPSGATLAPSVEPPVPREEIAEASRFRNDYGLRADEAWIVAVRAHPLASSREFGVPLLPHEIAELEQRARNAEAVAPVVREYGREHADAFGGLYIDQQQSGGVVGLFTADLAAHEAAIRAQLHPAGRFATRQVRFTEVALEALNERVLADLDWFDAAGMSFRYMEIDIPDNSVSLGIWSEDPTAADRVRARFQAGDMMEIWWDQDALVLLPRGALRGRVIDQDGNPVADLEIEAIGDIGDAEPDWGVGYGTNEDGRFEIPRLAAMGWEIRAVDAQPGEGRRVVGSTHVVMTGNTATEIVIRVRL